MPAMADADTWKGRQGEGDWIGRGCPCHLPERVVCDCSQPVPPVRYREIQVVRCAPPAQRRASRYGSTAPPCATGALLHCPQRPSPIGHPRGNPQRGGRPEGSPTGTGWCSIQRAMSSTAGSGNGEKGSTTTMMKVINRASNAGPSSLSDSRLRSRVERTGAALEAICGDLRLAGAVTALWAFGGAG